MESRIGKDLQLGPEVTLSQLFVPMEQVATSSGSVPAVSLPNYWSQNPDAWFSTIEAQLKAANITSEETAYYKVLAVLPESAAVKVREITRKEAYTVGDYQKLKKKLITESQIKSPSMLERLDRLGELKNVTHKKPSELLNDLELLFWSAIDEHVIPTNDYTKKFWWLRSLPVPIQQSLLPVANESSVSNLVAIADHMYASCAPVDSVAEISHQGESSSKMEDPSIAAVLRRKRSAWAKKKEQAKKLLSCEYVFLRTDATREPLELPYTGPYKVIERDKSTVKIETPSGQQRVSIQRVKPAEIDPGSFNQPRKRGRPPKKMSAAEGGFVRLRCSPDYD